MTPSSPEIEVRRMLGGDRLQVAREFRGWTKEELGRRTGLTGAAIGQFERGQATPNATTIHRLAAELGVPMTFFAVGADSGGGTGAYFRSLRSTTLTQRRRARAFVQYVHQFVGALEQSVELPELGLERHPVDPGGDSDQIEEIAAATRRSWGVHPTEPLPNAVRLLERQGIVVVRNYSGDSGIDAFSVPFDDRPLIVLSAEKGKHDRSRFDVLHEAGHLTMHRPAESSTKELEDQAHRFAAAVLLPAAGVRRELPGEADWTLLLRLKQKWGASVAALLRRSRDLGKMSETGYVNAMKALSARGWRKHEPGNIRPEEPSLLRRAVEVAWEEQGIPLEDLAKDAALPVEFVKALVTSATDPRPRVRI